MMTQKTSVLALCITLASASASFAKAGGMEGGGGKSVVCRSSSGKIRSAEVLDLFEGRAVYQLSYKEKSTPWKTQGTNIIRTSGVPTWTDPAEIAVWFDNASKNLVILPKGVALQPVDDSLEPIIPPKGCSVEQTVNYQSDNRILVNGEIWAAMSETQKAALVLHEATYRHLRNYSETDSRRARHFVAYLFSGGTVQNTWPDGSNDAPVICGPADSEHLSAFIMKVDVAGVPMLRFYFTSLNRLLLSRSYIEFRQFLMTDSNGQPIDLLEQLVNPTMDGLSYFGGVTVSNFEAGDKLSLGFSKGSDGKLAPYIYGTSIVDEAPISIELKCNKRQQNTL